MNKQKKVSLVVLAAGMGSRYGGLKQMDGFGPHDETIIDYSLYDALKAGFNHIVFIIRDYFADDFKNVFNAKLAGRVSVEYVTQELDLIPVPFSIPDTREKPWGTGHAVWIAHSVCDGPFGVINADDYYGTDSYSTLYHFLTTGRSPEEYCVVGYKLGNTLSAHGSVNRGVCQVSPAGYLEGILECKQIEMNSSGAISYPDETTGERIPLTKDTPVSMNMWGFFPSYFHFFEREFGEFLKLQGQLPKSEYYIPTLIDTLIHNGERQTRVLTCDAEWFGVTYREDKSFVSGRLDSLIAAGVYPSNLWG